jgi:glycosyltransferase involved in cell wall biosynthesis
VVASPIPPGLAGEIEAGRRPRRDFFELQRNLGAFLINYARPTGPVSRLMWWLLGPAAAHAWLAFTRRAEYEVVHTLSEDVGLLLALLFKLARVRRRHVMVAHRLTPLKKRLLLRLFRLEAGLDRIIVYGPRQRQAAVSQLGLPASKVEMVLHPADHLFWRPLDAQIGRAVCSAGLESRDYETLLRAVEGLPIEVRIAASSPWSKSRNRLASRALPINVRVVALGPVELRQLYAESSCVVVPLHDVDFQAGSLVVYEAMACGKAVIATRSRGLQDIFRDDGPCALVPVRDPDAMRAALLELIDHPGQAEARGQAARRAVEEGLNLDEYVERVSRIIRSVANPEPVGIPPAPQQTNFVLRD